MKKRKKKQEKEKERAEEMKREKSSTSWIAPPNLTVNVVVFVQWVKQLF